MRVIMNSKIKILIGVLVVGIVLIGGLLILRFHKPLPTKSCQGLNEEECIREQGCEPIYVYLTESERKYEGCKEKSNEKSCSTDEDCVLINRGCCPICGPGDAVNKIAAMKINLIKKHKCLNVNCPLIECFPSPIKYIAICENLECKVGEFASCSRICSGEDSEYYSHFLNKTKNELIQKCHCDEIPLIVKNCDVKPEVYCFSHRIIVVGTVKEVKLLEYPFQEIKMKVDKSFNKRLKNNTIVFKAGRGWALEKGDKIKVFINDANYAGTIDILTLEEYQELIDAKYFEYLPLSILKE